MNTQLSSKPVEKIVAAIQALDLEPIKFKLMDKEEGQGWSREQVERMAVAYKGFLTLLAKHPEASIAPNKDIDKFWHGHILDTMKYAEDCEQVFGFFLHHFPYFGMRGQADAADLAQAGNEMARLYAQEFGEPMPEATSAYCAAAKPAYCAAGTTAAYCAASAKAAYCAASKPAYCAASAKAAYCAASKPAYCAAAVQAAYCAASTPTNDAAYCAAEVRAAYCAASAGPDLQTRPRLAVAA